MAAPAMVRDSGEVWLGLQVQHNFGDPSRDLGGRAPRCLRRPRPARRWSASPSRPATGRGSRTWSPTSRSRSRCTKASTSGSADVDDSPELAAALEQAQGAASPTARLASVASAYWTHLGDKEFLRWVMPEQEDDLLDAFARLHVAGEDRVVDGARLIGMFRAHGVRRPGLGAPGRHRRRGRRGRRRRAAGAPGRRARRGSGPDHRGAVGARRPGEPSGHHPLSPGHVSGLVSRGGRAPRYGGVSSPSPRPGAAGGSGTATRPCSGSLSALRVVGVVVLRPGQRVYIPRSMRTVPGRATLVSRAAMLTTGPNTSPSRVTSSP